MTNSDLKIFNIFNGWLSLLRENKMPYPPFLPPYQFTNGYLVQVTGFLLFYEPEKQHYYWLYTCYIPDLNKTIGLDGEDVTEIQKINPKKAKILLRQREEWKP